MTSPSPVRPAFDAVADGYDRRFTDQPIARQLRAEVMRSVAVLLPPEGGNVLEAGCGTGEDARAFASQGHRVLATDAAHGMLRQARDKAGTPPAYTTAVWTVGQEIPAQVSQTAPYDLVFSNFGAVNCFDDLPGFGRDCAALLTPGGHVALVAINRWCLMEILLGAVRFDLKSMIRRFRKTQITRLEDGTALWVHFPSRTEISQQMGSAFAPVAWQPVGVFLPPSEYYTSFQKRPRLARFATWLDRHIAPAWPFSRLGDHVLIILRYDPSAAHAGAAI